MTSIILEFLHFFLFVFLPFIVPIVVFGYGSYVFFAEGQYFGSVAFLFMAVILIVALLMRKKPLNTKKIEWLKTHGQKIMTEFKKLDRRWNFRINGEPPFVIYSQANGRIFESEDVWSSNENDPFYINDGSTRALETLQSRDPNSKYLITVYVNPAKPKEYYMDLGTLEVK